MVPNNFTTKSREAIEAAQALKDGHSNPELDPLHLLLALLEQDGGVVRSILKKIGVDATVIAKAAVQSIDALPTADEETGDTLQIVLASATMKVLREAEKQASH